jgi:hypothetical protein
MSRRKGIDYHEREERISKTLANYGISFQAIDNLIPLGINGECPNVKCEMNTNSICKIKDNIKYCSQINKGEEK